MSLPEPIKALGKATLNTTANKFVDFVITKYTGKSVKVFEIEGDIEADKVKTRWEVLEKPFWLQAEAQKMNRQYSNMSNTLIKGSDYIEITENKVLDTNDVFWGLVEHSKEISDEEVQDLIAKILAGEYNQPDTYSMSTLQTLKMLGKQELNLFEKMAGFLVDGTRLPHELFVKSEHIDKFNIDFEQFQNLQNLGLFLPNEMQSTIPNPENKPFSVHYFEQKLLFNLENTEVNTAVKMPNYYGLSTSGKQILQHLKPKKVELYYEWLKENYKISNYKLQK